MGAMTLPIVLAALSALAASAFITGCDESERRPPQPGWQTAENACHWHWVEGGGLGLWAEACQLSTGHWRVSWSEAERAFVMEHGTQTLEVVVQAWSISPDDSGMSSLLETLVQAGHLKPDHDCRWTRTPHRSPPGTAQIFVLQSATPNALAPTLKGEVPEALCGPYGQSTHGVRYFIVDRRWPDRAIFVNEGQERPMFDPESITWMQ